MGKGSRTERELVNMLWDEGFAVMRSPSSGGGRKQPQPDILASNQNDIYGFECKSTSKNKVYIRKKEIVKLKVFCSAWGYECLPLIALRFDREDWLFILPNQMKKTKKSYTISKERAKDVGFGVDGL